MKTNDDDNNMMSSTTKDGSHLLKMTFSLSQTTPEDKGRQSRGRKRASQNDTHEMTHKKIQIKKNSRYFLEQETVSALLSTGWFQERITA